MPKKGAKAKGSAKAPDKLADLQAEKHSAKQMSVLIAKHMGLDNAMSLPPAEVVTMAKERLRNGEEPTSPAAKPGGGEVKRQLIDIRDALMAADKVQPAPEVQPAAEPAEEPAITLPSKTKKAPPPTKPKSAAAPAPAEAPAEPTVDESVEMAAPAPAPAAAPSKEKKTPAPAPAPEKKAPAPEPEPAPEKKAPAPEPEPSSEPAPASEPEPEPVPEPEPAPEPEPPKEKPSEAERFGSPKWIGDDEFPGCMVCDEEFWLFRRRHHCRACGWLVCDACSPQRRELCTIVGDSGTTDGAEGEKYRCVHRRPFCPLAPLTQQRAVASQLPPPPSSVTDPMMMIGCARSRARACACVCARVRCPQRL
jgi:hypothetical protein